MIVKFGPLRERETGEEERYIHGNRQLFLKFGRNNEHTEVRHSTNHLGNIYYYKCSSII